MREQYDAIVKGQLLAGIIEEAPDSLGEKDFSTCPTGQLLGKEQ